MLDCQILSLINKGISILLLVNYRSYWYQWNPNIPYIQYTLEFKLQFSTKA